MEAVALLSLAMDVIAQTSQAFKLFIEESIAKIPSELSPVKQTKITEALKQIKKNHDFHVASVIESISNLQEVIKQRKTEQIIANDPLNYAFTDEQIEKTVESFINNYTKLIATKISFVETLVVSEYIFECYGQSFKNLSKNIDFLINEYLEKKQKIKS